MNFQEILNFFKALEQGIFTAKAKNVDEKNVESEDSVEAIKAHKQVIPVVEHKNFTEVEDEEIASTAPLARAMKKSSDGIPTFEVDIETIHIKPTELTVTILDQDTVDEESNKMEETIKSQDSGELELLTKEKPSTLLDEMNNFSHMVINQGNAESKTHPDNEEKTTDSNISNDSQQQNANDQIPTFKVYMKKDVTPVENTITTQNTDTINDESDAIKQVINLSDQSEPTSIKAVIPVPPSLPPKKVLAPAASVQNSNEDAQADVTINKGKAKLELDSVEPNGALLGENSLNGKSQADKFVDFDLLNKDEPVDDDLRQGKQQQQDDNDDNFERKQMLGELMHEINHFDKNTLKKVSVNAEPKTPTPHDALMAQIPTAAKQLKSVANPEDVRAQKIQAIAEGNLNRPLNAHEELMKAIREHSELKNTEAFDEVPLNDKKIANDSQPTETNKLEAQSNSKSAKVVIPAPPALPPKKVMTSATEVKQNNILLEGTSFNEKFKADKSVHVNLSNKNESAEDDLRQGKQQQQGDNTDDEDAHEILRNLMNEIHNFDTNALKKVPVNTESKAQTAHDALMTQIPTAAKQLKNVANPEDVRAQKIQAIAEGNPNRPLNAREELMKAIREQGKLKNTQQAEEVKLQDVKITDDAQQPTENSNKIEEEIETSVNNNLLDKTEPAVTVGSVNEKLVIPVPPPMPLKKGSIPANLNPKNKQDSESVAKQTEEKAKIEVMQVKPNVALLNEIQHGKELKKISDPELVRAQKLKAIDESATPHAAAMNQIVKGVKLKKVDPSTVQVSKFINVPQEVTALKKGMEKRLPMQQENATVEQTILKSKCSNACDLILEKITTRIQEVGKQVADQALNKYFDANPTNTEIFAKHKEIVGLVTEGLGKKVVAQEIAQQLPEEIKSLLTEDEFFGVEEADLPDTWNNGHTNALVEKIAKGFENALQHEITAYGQEAQKIADSAFDSLLPQVEEAAPTINVSKLEPVGKTVGSGEGINHELNKTIANVLLARRAHMDDSDDSDNEMDDDFEDDYNSHDGATEYSPIKMSDVIQGGGVPSMKASSDALTQSDIFSGESDLVDMSMHTPSPVSHAIPGFELDYHQPQL